MEVGGGPAPTLGATSSPGVRPACGLSLPRAPRASGCRARPLPSDRAPGEVQGASTEWPGRQEGLALTGLHGGGDAPRPACWVLRAPGAHGCVSVGGVASP